MNQTASTMPSINEHAALVHLLQEKSAWHAIGQELIQIRDKRSYQERSFTAFLGTVSRKFDLSVQTLRNHISAVEIYRQWQEEIPEFGLPDFHSNDYGAGEWAILFANRIKKVTTKQAYGPICSQVARGELKKAELARMWNAYKAAPGASPEGNNQPQSEDETEDSEQDVLGKIARFGFSNWPVPQHQLSAIVKADTTVSLKPRPLALGVTGSGQTDVPPEFHVFFREQDWHPTFVHAISNWPCWPCKVWGVRANPEEPDTKQLSAFKIMGGPATGISKAKQPEFLPEIICNLLLKPENRLR